MKLGLLLLGCLLPLAFGVVEKWLSEDKDYWMSEGQKILQDALNLKHNTNIARNAILFLGDGMGISTITGARILKGQQDGGYGEDYKLNMEKFPYSGLSKIYNTDRMVPDSAGTGTAYQTGVKTRFGVVGVDTLTEFAKCDTQKGREVTSLLDWALVEGKSVGLISTARVTHASPAAGYAHSASRLWESDADILALGHVNESCKDIALQLIDDNPNIQVILGGGRVSFLPAGVPDPETGGSTGRHARLDGRNLITEWTDEKAKRGVSHAYVYNKEQFDAINPADTDYLLGLFENSYMQYEMDRDNTATGEPSIVDMVEKAIAILDKNPKGYYLFVEGGNIDIAHHYNLGQKALVEAITLDAAIGRATEIVNEADTLMVVTADHSHSFTINGFPSRGRNILGLVDGLTITDDGLPYTILTYGTGPGHKLVDHAAAGGRPNLTDVNYLDKEYPYESAIPQFYSFHSGEDVGIFARGPMAHLIHGVQEQHYIPHVIAYATCIGMNQDHCVVRKRRGPALFT